MSQLDNPASPAFIPPDRQRIEHKLSKLRHDTVEFVVLVAIGLPVLFVLLPLLGQVRIPFAAFVALLGQIAVIGVLIASIGPFMKRVRWVLRRDPMTLPPEALRTWVIIREDLPMTRDEALRRSQMPTAEAERALELLMLIDEIALEGDRLVRSR